MEFLDISTDVLAIKCVENYIFVGVGCKLYVIDKIGFKFKFKINALHPDNIHGIVFKNNKLIVYGGKCLCWFDLDLSNNQINIKKSDILHKFDDWIINIEWLEPLDNTNLTVLFAHNNVFNFDLDEKKYFNTACKETCLLYAGSISGNGCNNAIIFSGTVFQEILIWKVNQIRGISSYSEVLHRLKGHKGVIFSVFYNSSNNLICSTSDDRTVRLWKVISECNSNQTNMLWENVEISLQATMYGHLARVWKAIMLKDTIASIGEDSRICFWDLSGKLLNKVEAHSGAPIWCIDMSQDNIIYTGGADGSVNSWPSTKTTNYVHNNVALDTDMVPKYVNYLDNCDIIVYANIRSTSKLLHYSDNENLLKNVYDLPEHNSSYCIMEISLDRKSIALASIKGEITLYKRLGYTWTKNDACKITDFKICSMQWLNFDSVLISAAEGHLYVVQFSTNSIKILTQHRLPASRERWVTTACLYDDVMICGDRMGSIFVYKLAVNYLDPIQSFKKIHGRLGVQSCIIVKDNLLTSGRDGKLRFYNIYKVDSDSPKIEYIYSKNMPMDWVSKVLKYQNDYYVLGFKEDDFVVYSIPLKRILVKFSCGGGHRSWDCMICNKQIHFVFIKKKQFHSIVIPLDTLYFSPLLTGFCRKEIYCVKSIPTVSRNYNILVSGGEDCTLNLLHIDSLTREPNLNLKNLDSYDGHLSCIKCISIFNLSEDENFSKSLIFSGGGRAQLRIWEVTIKLNNSLFKSEDLLCKDVSSYMLYGPDRERDKVWVGKELMYNIDPEMRYMDMSTLKNTHTKDEIFIFVACSDGYLRTFTYNIVSNEIKLINTLAYNNRCILKVHSFAFKEEIFLITMATDGDLNFWHFCFKNEEEVDVKKLLIDGETEFHLHQSGINSFDFTNIDDNEYLLATGGDDNLLSLTRFQMDLPENGIPTVKIISIWKTNSVHYAQVTGIKLLNNKWLLSVGADQKLAIHKYSFTTSEITSILVKDKTLCIPDIQGFTFIQDSRKDTSLFCVYGKGIQLLEYQNNEFL